MRPPSGAMTYRGADGTLLRTDGWAVLLGVPAGHPLVARCWDLLVAAPELDAVLAVVASRDLREPPAYAVLRVSVEPHLVTRGAVTAVLDDAPLHPTETTAADVDRTLTDVASVTVSLGGGRASGPALPFGEGVVAASAFHLVLGGRGDGLGSGRSRAGGPADAAETEAGTATVAAGAAARRASASQDTLPSAVTGGLLPAEHPWSRSRDGIVPVGVPSTRALVTPRVLSARCPAGHLTPAYSDVCRVCRRPVAVQEVVETPRPVLGRLVLPHGEVVPMDRGAVLGRAPYVPEDWAGAEPHLVTLRDPDHDVSAQHLTVVLDLWDVLVRDLGSTNGTRLLGADGSVTPLRPHQPVPLRPGGALVLADVVTVRFEALP